MHTDFHESPVGMQADVTEGTVGWAQVALDHVEVLLARIDPACVVRERR